MKENPHYSVVLFILKPEREVHFVLAFCYLFRELERREGDRGEETHKKVLVGLHQKQDNKRGAV